MSVEKHDLFEEAGIKQGVVPVHMGFSNFIPSEDGNLPRGKIETESVPVDVLEEESLFPKADMGNKLDALEAIDRLLKISTVKIHVMQIPVFPGTKQSDIDELIKGISERNIEPQLIMMVPAGNPMNAEDSDKVTGILGEGVQTAIRNKITSVSSTSLEPWMGEKTERTGAEYGKAVEQLAKLHAKVYTEQKMEENGIESWNIEFLRPGEMMTFTKLSRAWEVVKAMNAAIGGKQFFKVLVDSAHCGDSGEDVGETQKLLEEMIQAGDVSMVHVSVPTTRGADASDKTGMRAAVTATATKHRKRVLLAVDEVFEPDPEKDPVTNDLRQKRFGGFGTNTGVNGESTTEVLANNLANTRTRVLAALAQERYLAA